MNVSRMVLREIRHRKWNFILSLLSIAAAVACLVGAVTVLDADELRTTEILSEQSKQVEARVRDKKAQVADQVAVQKVMGQQAIAVHEATVVQAIQEREKAVAAAGKELEDAMRKIMKGLGFNVLILPAEQDLNELHVDGTLSATMAETYVKKLADSKIMTINHLLPLLTKKIKWDEKDGRPIVLTGTRGEVPLMHRPASNKKKPLQDLVARGTMVVGFRLHQDLKLKVGDMVELMGREFKITETYAERGNVDDSTVWINLEEAQEMLGMENLVHGILALECNCATADRLGEIRAEIGKVLPGTQIIERGPQALARAEARNHAKSQAVSALAREKQMGASSLARQKQLTQETIDREETNASAAIALEETQGQKELEDQSKARFDFREQRESVAGMLVPLMVLTSIVWVGLLTYNNVRQRSSEIGILRAIGLNSKQILGMFLAKAVLIGLLGAIIGYTSGFVAGTAISDYGLSSESLGTLYSPMWLIWSLVLAPILASVASWIPAFMAATQDPAVVLQDA